MSALICEPSTMALLPVKAHVLSARSHGPAVYVLVRLAEGWARV